MAAAQLLQQQQQQLAATYQSAMMQTVMAQNPTLQNLNSFQQNMAFMGGVATPGQQLYQQTPTGVVSGLTNGVAAFQPIAAGVAESTILPNGGGGNAPLMTAAFLEKLDWKRIENDKSTFEDFAKKGNIPIPKLKEVCVSFCCIFRRYIIVRLSLVRTGKERKAHYLFSF